MQLIYTQLFSPCIHVEDTNVPAVFPNVVHNCYLLYNKCTCFYCPSWMSIIQAHFGASMERNQAVQYNPIYGPHVARSYCVKLQHQKHMEWCTKDMWKSTTNVGLTHALPINLVELVMIVVVWMVVVTVVVEFGSIEVPLHPLESPCASIAWESQTDESTLHQTGWKVLDHQQQGHLPVVLWSIKKMYICFRVIWFTDCLCTQLKVSSCCSNTE